MIKRLAWLTLVIVLVLSQLVSGCSGGPKSGNNPGNNSSPITKAPPRGLTGTITTGKAIDAASASISSTGGKITVNQADSLVNGLELSIPSGSYKDKREFKVEVPLIKP